ncbi:MAG: hypothetical protein PHU46_10835 [Rhodocyclaceae bacterium]|nr:hypothetical protein [Rhodocyclaceae bacterium]
MPLLPFLALWSVLAFAGAVGMAGLSDFPRQLPAHLAFAVGAMPLIFAAMGHFVPVLTRSGNPPAAVARLPLLALLGGLGVVASFAWPPFWFRGPSLAALPALAATLALIAWIRARGRGGLGSPHPGLWWYPAALSCLALALLAVPTMELFPGARPALRLLHLHLNTLGFIGLTAIGTLQVLLPTCVGRPDPGAAARLRRDLPRTLLGVLLVSVGAAWDTTPGRLVALAGLILWLLPLLRLAAAWWKLFRTDTLSRDGAAASLAAALAGLILLSLGHGFGLASGMETIGAFFLAFLLPLVTGAVSQLLPVWLRPGRQDAWHAGLRAALGRFAGLRGASFVLAGLGWSLGWKAAALLVLPGMVQFLGTVALKLLFPPRP